MKKILLIVTIFIMTTIFISCSGRNGNGSVSSGSGAENSILSVDSSIEQESSDKETDSEASTDATDSSGEEDVSSDGGLSEEESLQSEENSSQQESAEQSADEPESKPPLGGGDESSEETVWTGPIVINTPAAGSSSISDKNCTIDYSNASKGYVMIKCDEPGSTFLINIAAPSKIYSYNINSNGSYEVFPLQEGSGIYTVTIYKQIIRPSTGQEQWISVLKHGMTVGMANDYTAYLYPNQYVNYDKNSAAVKKSFDLCVNASTELEKINAIFGYIANNIKYDYNKAATATTRELPDVDRVLSEKKGICFDYAALMACMLRAQGIPAKLVIGYQDSTYHAWNMVYTKEKGWITLGIMFDGKTYKLMDSTYASTMGISETEKLIQQNKYTLTEVY